MNVLDLIQMQGMLFLMIIIGAVLRKRGVIDEHGKRCLTDLCVNIVIPCNIIKSFLIELDPSVLRVWFSIGCCSTAMRAHKKRCCSIAPSSRRVDSLEILSQRAFMAQWDCSTHPFSSFPCV